MEKEKKTAKKKSTALLNITLRLEPELHEQIKEASAKDDRSIQKWIIHLIKKALNKND